MLSCICAPDPYTISCHGIVTMVLLYMIHGTVPVTTTLLIDQTLVFSVHACPHAVVTQTGMGCNHAQVKRTNPEQGS